MLSKSKKFKAAKYVFSAFRATIRSIYFSDEVSIYGDVFIRFILSTSSIPIILLVWSTTHSILQCVVWTLIMPVIQEAEESYSDLHSAKQLSFLALLWQIGFRIAPFVTVSVCATSVGTKLMGCFGSAMIDANASLNGIDYPLMRSQIIFLNEKSSRLIIWLVTFVVTLSIIILSIRKSVILWYYWEPKLCFIAFAAFLFEVAFVLLSLFKELSSDMKKKLRHSCLFWTATRSIDSIACVRELISHTTLTWWPKNISYMRVIALFFVVIGTVFFCFQTGVVQGVTLGMIMLMYCGIPHIFLSATLHAAVSIIRIFRSFMWLRRHSDALILVIIIGLPYQVVMNLSILYFLNYSPILILLFCNDIMLIAKAIDLVREFDVSEHGSVTWRYKRNGKLVRPMVAIQLEDAFEKKQRTSGVVSLDMSFDIDKMEIVDRFRKLKVTRVQVIPYGASRRFRFNTHFYLYTLPRLLSLQNRGDFSGTYFRAVRIILRVLVVSTYITVLCLVLGIIAQASFTLLKPPPVTAWVYEKGVLAFDHIVVRLFFLSQKFSSPFIDSLGKDFSGRKWDLIRSDPGEDFYPQMCKREFYGTSIFELAVLTLIPYISSSVEMSQMIDYINSHFGSDWELRERYGAACQPGPRREPSGWNGYIDLFSEKRNLTVISIRGTDLFSFKDFLMDVSLFFESVLYQFASSNVPGAILTPKNLVEDLIRVASIPPQEPPSFDTWKEILLKKNTSVPVCQLDNYRRDFFVDVYNHLAYVGSTKKPTRALLTGHSMGGTIAAIIGSQMHIEALSFSAPGIYLARKKYSLSAHAIHRYVTSVVTSNDVFPSIGQQGGEVHHMMCLSSLKEACHALEFIVGSLWRSCSSIRDRYPLIYDVI